MSPIREGKQIRRGYSSSFNNTNHSEGTIELCTNIKDAEFKNKMLAKYEKIVDYSFEKNEKSNVLSIHPTRPLIAYLLNIQRTPKISKAWTSGNESVQSPASSSINGQLNQSLNADKSKTVSIRIIDYVTRKRCLAKGIYHARPADCAFSINSLVCAQNDVLKLAVVDRLANIYLYDLTYFIDDLIATRIAIIRGPGQDVSPCSFVSTVWCPFVPCEDFDDGDGGLRLAVSTDSNIEIFAVDRLAGRTGELHRNELKNAYKCIPGQSKTNVVSLSISPDCSTISSAAQDNRVTFYSSDIDDGSQKCLHNWEAGITDGTSISKLFFLDDYPKLLDDSNMKFWGSAFIGTKGGQMLLVNLQTWTVYQRVSINTDSPGPRNFDYRIDLTAHNIVALDGDQCFVVQIEHDHSKMSTTVADSAIVSNLNDLSMMDANNSDMTNGNLFNYLLKSASSTPQRAASQIKPPNPLASGSASKKSQNNMISSTGSSNHLPKIARMTRLGLHNSIYSFVIKHKSVEELELFTISAHSLERYTINLSAMKGDPIDDIPMPDAANPCKAVEESPANLDVTQMDRMVEALFAKLNTAFSQGLDEFLNDVKGEVNDLKLKLNGLCRDVRKLQQQLQETTRQK